MCIRDRATDIRIHAEHILKTREKLNRILSESTGQSIEKIDKGTERDNIMDAETALKYGLIDRIGDPISEISRKILYLIFDYPHKHYTFCLLYTSRCV